MDRGKCPLLTPEMEQDEDEKKIAPSSMSLGKTTTWEASMSTTKSACTFIIGAMSWLVSPLIVVLAAEKEMGDKTRAAKVTLPLLSHPRPRDCPLRSVGPRRRRPCNVVGGLDVSPILARVSSKQAGEQQAAVI